MDLLTLAVLASQAVAPALPVTPSVGPVQTSRFVAVVAPALPVITTSRATVPAAADTVFEYSAAYYRRLDIHRVGSYAMLPLFAFQYVAGSQLYDKSIDAPGWAKTGHRVAATGVAALFGVNTVTGLMNLYEGRKDPQDRGRKVFHAVMMLAADAGFAATGILAERAEGSSDDRDLHRTIAIGSVGVATIGYLAMLDLFRRD
jgi:hypothetical protein